MIDFLIEHGADVFIRDKTERIAQDIAIHLGKEVTIKRKLNIIVQKKLFDLSFNFMIFKDVENPKKK